MTVEYDRRWREALQSSLQMHCAPPSQGNGVLTPMNVPLQYPHNGTEDEEFVDEEVVDEEEP